MNRFLIITAMLLLILPSPARAQENEGEDNATAQPVETTEDEEKTPVEQPAVPSPAPPAATTQAPEEEPFDEGLFEDEEGAVSAGPVSGAAEKEEEEARALPRKVTIDAVIIVKYIYQDSGESYSVKYHINMGGEISADVGLIKGNAKVATDISGFLAKSPAFECLLKVSIADVPYEIMFKKVSDKEADINVAFKGQILEDWESLCTFLDTSGAKFNTRGLPERWIGVALEKAKPPLSKLTTPIDPKKATSLKFTVQKQTVPDESIGSVEIEGTGVVTVKGSGLPI